MNLYLKSITVLLVLCTLSCNTSKESKSHSTAKKMSNTEENKSKKLIENGYSIGTIVTKSSGECMVLIEEASSKKLYDPINIEEEQFKVFMSDALPIYFKFLPLKRMNRCNAQPIKILDIKKREGQ